MNGINLLKMLKIVLKTIRIVCIALVLSLAAPKELPEDSPGYFSSEQFQEIDCIQQMLHHEARGEGELGIQSVMSVVINRKNHPDYPKTFCKIINQKSQFSFIKSNYKCKKTELDICWYIYNVAIQSVQGKFESILPQQVLFYTHKDIRPVWTKKMKKYMVLNNHVFYLKIV